MGIRLIKKNNEAAPFTLPRDVADAMKLVKSFLEENKDVIAGEQLISDADASVGYQLDLTLNVLSDLVANTPKFEPKDNEALSPKMQQRLKVNAWQEATDKMKGFDEAGHTLLDMIGRDGKYHKIALPVEGMPTEAEARKVAEKIFGDLEDYIDYGVDYEDEDGAWYPYYGLKKEFFDLSKEEGLAVLKEFDDVLYKAITRGIKAFK